MTVFSGQGFNLIRSYDRIIKLIREEWQMPESHDLPPLGLFAFGEYGGFSNDRCYGFFHNDAYALQG